jgi:pilus assembly protein Flp/PilA
MWNELSRLVRLIWAPTMREEGQGLVEYALILSLVSVATIVILTAVGTSIGNVFSSVTSAL